MSHQIRPIILKKPYLQIIDLGKTLMIYAKKNDISLNNSSKKIVIDTIEIFNLYIYFFLSQYAIKLLKLIMIFWFAPKSDINELKYIYFQVEKLCNRFHPRKHHELIRFALFLIQCKSHISKGQIVTFNWYYFLFNYTF